MASSVTAPMERQFGQVPGLAQMIHQFLWRAVITLQFTLEQNIDIAEQEVQAAINASTTFLPRDLPIRPSTARSIPQTRPSLLWRLRLTAWR